MDEYPPAYLVVDPGSDHERTLPIHDRFYIGRECVGISTNHCLIVDDRSVSRSHLEIRVDAAQNQAWVVDGSVNGTWVNGARIERNVPVQLRPGDRIAVAKASSLMEFRSDGLDGASASAAKKTVADIFLSRMALVVGDIIQYSTFAEYTDTEVLVTNVGRLYGELSQLLAGHSGRINNFVGDAFFAVWEVDDDPSGVMDALNFAVAAHELVGALSPELSLRCPGGDPIRMGWAVTEGLVGVSTVTNMVVALGDATNLVFRLSGLAGRDGRADVVATQNVLAFAQDHFRFDCPEDVTVKGRSARERIYAVHALADKPS
jgi:adenylate cyclase